MSPQKKIASLHLAAIAMSLGIVALNLNYVSPDTITIALAVFVIYAGFHGAISFYRLDMKIIEQSIKEHQAKNKEQIEQEMNQAIRKAEFKRALLSEEEKNEQERKREILKKTNEKLAEAEKSYQTKKFKEMSDTEKIYYYTHKLRKFHTWTAPFLVAFPIISGILYLHIQTTISLSTFLQFMIPYISFLLACTIVSKHWLSKKQHYTKKAEPKFMREFMKEIGMRD